VTLGELARIGEYCFPGRGNRWRSAFAAKLGVSTRAMHRWATGAERMPLARAGQIVTIARRVRAERRRTVDLEFATLLDGLDPELANQLKKKE
jgi:hypothetical protein